jgi:hypothetical protein
MRGILTSLIAIIFAFPELEQQNAELEKIARTPMHSSPAARQNAGQTAKSSVGRAGERRTIAQATGAKPLARINGRIDNRINSRIVSRIDRNYDAQADGARSFAKASGAVAGAQRNTGRDP